jgi:hypothetical protein
MRFDTFSLFPWLQVGTSWLQSSQEVSHVIIHYLVQPKITLQTISHSTTTCGIFFNINWNFSNRKASPSYTPLEDWTSIAWTLENVHNTFELCLCIVTNLICSLNKVNFMVWISVCQDDNQLEWENNWSWSVWCYKLKTIN